MVSKNVGAEIKAGKVFTNKIDGIEKRRVDN